jgi:DNA-binding beta-propeller fold protein YncE
MSLVVAAVLTLASPPFTANALRPPEVAPTNQSLTPDAAPDAIFQALNPHLDSAPDYTVGQASAVSISPDGRTLLILTSGFNRMFGADGKLAPEQSTEWLFVFDVAGRAPIQRQAIPIANAFIGLAWSPSGDRAYISGGVDDKVLEFHRTSAGLKAARMFSLGHRTGLGLEVAPEVAGLAVSPDGRWLLAANVQNDSVSLVDLATGAVSEQDLRPGVIDPKRTGAPGGTFPRAVAWVSDTKAYVASERDREIIALARLGGKVEVGSRLRTPGQPVALLAGPPARLYAALDNTDAAVVIDSRRDQILEVIPTAGPNGMNRRRLGGAGSNALALSPGARTLLVTNGGENALALIALDPVARGEAQDRPERPAGHDDDDDRSATAGASKVVGLVPTGWYPTGVAVRPDGGRIFVVNGKSNTGPVPLGCRNSLKTGPKAEDTCRAANQYVWQREKAGFLTLSPPTTSTLATLTRRVETNNHVLSAPSAADQAKMAFLRAHIRHVIYVVKENRTYDQILGDLEVGNGDPRLAVFGRAMTPNSHALAAQFVDLDAFFDSGESSNTGWNWSLAARTNDWTEREAPVNYAKRGLQYDQEGDNRNLNVGFATTAERLAANPLGPHDPNTLPGARDVAAPDAPDGAEERGYLWDRALKAGRTVRNYGFYGDLALYEPQAGARRVPLLREPYKDGVAVFTPAKASLMAITDPYFRGFDQSFPDYWRVKEWAREFDGFVAAGQAPELMMVRLPHDHTGDFGKGLDGVDTVETELADNDYAVGLLVEKVAHSPFASNTLIFIIEDDAQDGPDHVDAHRSIALIAGPYVRHAAVVSRRYATVNLVATIEAILGLEPMGLNDALATPMADVFDPNQADWTFSAQPSEILRRTGLPLPPPGLAVADVCAPRTRTAAYWAAAMAGQDFSNEDKLDTPAYNLALWRGMMGPAPYPALRDGRDLRSDRARRIEAARVTRCQAQR